MLVIQPAFKDHLDFLYFKKHTVLKFQPLFIVST